jgi:hypothetical protein
VEKRWSRLIALGATAEKVFTPFQTHLGWNTWIHNQPLAHATDDADFVGQQIFWLQ